MAIFLLSFSFAASQETASNDVYGEDADGIRLESAEGQAAEPDAEAGETSRTDDPLPAGIAAVDSLIDKHTDKMGFAVRFGIAAAIIIVQALVLWLMWKKLFKWLADNVIKSGGDKIKPLTIHKLKVLSTHRVVILFLFLLRLLKYLLTAVQLIITVPLVFSLFPATRRFAYTMVGYVLNPLRNIFWGIIRHIPNLITIVVIIIITHNVVRVLKFFASQIAKEKLVIPRFYPEWAEPTYKIFHILVWAFTVAIAYPYLPGSDSRIFQGVSVLLGVIFSLGSSTAIGNLVAGLVITYMRPFKIGDRVQIKEITGFVVEKNLMVVRLKTDKNEYVTFPNLNILGSSIINYNTSTDEDEEGLILHVEVTFGYATSWKVVHETLINAALATDHVLKTPKPFVLQNGLDDFYARYQINCYTKDVKKVPKIYTLLYENIQSGFNEAGIDMTAAHYEVNALIKR